MPSFEFVGDSPRTFSLIGDVHPGDVIEAEDNPSPVFFDLVVVKPAKGKESD